MSIFTADDKHLQAAGVRAGLRTFGQTLEIGLGTGAVGGVVVGTANAGPGTVFSLDWKVLLGTVLFILLAAALAGVRSYLSFVTKGLPQQYVDAAAAGLLSGKLTSTVGTTTPIEDSGEHVAPTS